MTPQFNKSRFVGSCMVGSTALTLGLITITVVKPPNGRPGVFYEVVK